MSDLASRLETVREQIGRACDRAGRDPAEVTLVAVSKTFSVEVVLEAYNLGIRHFGENRVEEASAKIHAASRLDPPITWHMIGTVQHRKVKDAAGLFNIIESVDAVQLAERLESALAPVGKRMPVLVQINVGGESTKHGFPINAKQELVAAIERIAVLSHLEIRGLMTIAPIVHQPDEARPYFRAMRELVSQLQQQFPKLRLTDLSMGMTDDFPVAIEEGATIVRIGRAIFGSRR